jgi:hypothetical protein
LSDGTARELVRFIEAGLAEADAAGEAATAEARARAKAAFGARYGDDADALERDARALLKKAGPDAAAWLESSLEAAGGFHPGTDAAGSRPDPPSTSLWRASRQR